MAERRLRPQTIVVVGLGRFGMALAQELQNLGQEVLGVDADEHLVQAAAGHLTHVVQGDATDAELLVQLGVADVHHAVVAIGDQMQSSILATANLADLGVPDIWAKALTEQHARILERVGATNVVLPERDVGRRIAHRLAGNVLDYFAVDDGFLVVEESLPPRFEGMTIATSRLREDYGVSVIGLKPPDGPFAGVSPDTVLCSGSVVLVAGKTDDVERFSRVV